MGRTYTALNSTMCILVTCIISGPKTETLQREEERGKKNKEVELGMRWSFV